jgi:putative glycosyltransferase (TIGR04372 family)
MKLLRALLGPLLRVLDWIPFVVLYIAQVRFLRLTAPGRIGHLASEPDVFLKEQKLGMRSRQLGVLFIPDGVVANQSLVDYWARYLLVPRSRLARRIVGRFHRFSALTANISITAFNETAAYMKVQQAWGHRPPLLRLSEQHVRDGREGLVALGIPADADLVGFHCRSAGYSPSDDAMHAYRNSDIKNYDLALDELTKHGIWCIRMGDPSAPGINPRDRVVDYAHSDVRSDRMDVFLCARGRFFLGSSSGLLFLANVFGRPSGSANHAPLSTVIAFGANDVAIPKLFWSEEKNRLLTFPELFASEVSNFRFTELYERHGIRPMENGADEIRDLAIEMLERSNGAARYTDDDEARQRRFKSLMRPGHYSYGGATRVGRAFLRKYEHLLHDSAQ